MTTDSITLTQELAWPWSIAPWGPWALVLVALLLCVLTVWTYLGVARVGSRRMLTILGLRLFALLLAYLMMLRPSLAIHQIANVPSSLLLVLDRSESMTIQDEFANKSRWAAMQQLLEDSAPVLEKLQAERNVTLIRYHFAEDLQPWDENALPNGKRTDFGQMLQSLFKSHGRENNLRGLVIISDGADNGTRFSAVTEAARWRALLCPIHTFGLGQRTTAESARDIAVTGIVPTPAPVPVKAKLNVKASVNAQGFENAVVVVRLLIDDKEVLSRQETLRKTTGNEVVLVADAPETPGEIKVTVKVEPLPGEVSIANNEISTFVTVTKEGLSVLYVDKFRVFEPQFICDSLVTDPPRIRVYMAWNRTDRREVTNVDLFQFDKQHYDVIILGDMTARQLTLGNPAGLTQIHDLVKDKGTGLLMMGGYQSFGNSDWNGTNIAKLLPVDLTATGQLETDVRLEPTLEGLAHYILRLLPDAQANRELWKELPALQGITRLGKEKPGATVLATRSGTKEPVLVSQPYGKGRVIAFGGDTTWRWQRLGQPKSNKGVDAHAAFWRNLVLWLAHQDQADGNVWVRPDVRRVPAGSKVNFSVGCRGTGGEDLPDARYEVVAMIPPKGQAAVPTAREQGEERGTFWKTDVPGEYRLIVRAKAKGKDGKEIPGLDKPGEARFIVYQDDAEMLRRAADHDFLSKLASASGGSFDRAQHLKSFFEKLQHLPLPQNTPKTEYWPDWRRTSLSGFIVGLFLAFVATLCFEWFLRRTWGLV